MGLFGFGKKNEGGLMDSLSCDVKNYLIWKWRPKGQDVNTTNKENAIRTGSSLLVTEGQAAIFIYPNSNGKSDVILGESNNIIEPTGNFPVLANIIGTAYSGGTPFQARVYFITLNESGMQLKFATEFFAVRPSQPEFSGYVVPMSVKGTIKFAAAPTEKQLRGMYMFQKQNNMTSLEWDEFCKVTTQEAVRKLFSRNGGKDTTLEELEKNMLPTIISCVKGCFSKIPQGTFVLQANECIEQWSELVMQKIFEDVLDEYGIWLSRVNITSIDFDESAEDYQNLRDLTARQHYNISMQNQANVLSQMATDAAVRNGMVARQADIQMDHQEDMLGRMREEAQFAQHAQTESTAHRTNLASETAYLGAHTVNVQGAVMQSGMENLGSMGAMNFGGDGSGMNPAGMMMGMGMATGMAGQMGQMMGNMGNAFNNQVAQAGAPTPPPMPGQTPPAPPTPQAAAYFVLINNQQMGPCDMNTIRQMIVGGQVNAQTMVWANGMPQWAAAGTVPALAPLFQAPPTPPMPGSVPPPPPVM